MNDGEDAEVGGGGGVGVGFWNRKEESTFGFGLHVHYIGTLFSKKKKKLKRIAQIPRSSRGVSSPLLLSRSSITLHFSTFSHSRVWIAVSGGVG